MVANIFIGGNMKQFTLFGILALLLALGACSHDDKKDSDAGSMQQEQEDTTSTNSSNSPSSGT